jgi:hypothetical protein
VKYLRRLPVDATRQLILFLMGLTLAAAVHLFLPGTVNQQTWEYSVIADSLRSGGGGSYEYLGTGYKYYGPVIYPRLLAAVAWLTHGGTGAMLLLQAVLFAACASVVYALARLFVTPRWAFAAGLLAIGHPGNLVYAAKLHPHTLDVLLICTAFLLLCRFALETRLLVGVAAGLTLGLAMLSRGTIGSFAVAWAIWFLVHHRHDLIKATACVALTAACACVVISPLIVSGYAQYGKLIPLRTDTGANLWIGNNPRASGTLVTFEQQPRVIQDLIPPPLARELATMNEAQQNAALTNAAFDWIARNPEQFAKLFVTKLKYFWWFAPTSGRSYPSEWLMLYAAYYAPILISAIVGILYLFRAQTREYRRLAMMFTLMLVCYSMTQSLFYVEGRHRWEIEPLLLVLAVVGIAQSLQHRNPAFVPAT